MRKEKKKRKKIQSLSRKKEWTACEMLFESEFCVVFTCVLQLILATAIISGFTLAKLLSIGLIVRMEDEQLLATISDFLKSFFFIPSSSSSKDP